MYLSSHSSVINIHKSLPFLSLQIKVQNCIPSHKLANQYNFECKAIKYYLTHKKEIRNTITKAIGITIEEAKTCLLALMFGAKMNNTWEDNSIPKAIGKVKAGALFKHPTFKAIADELSHGNQFKESYQQAVISSYPRYRSSSIESLSYPLP